MGREARPTAGNYPATMVIKRGGHHSRVWLSTVKVRLKEKERQTNKSESGIPSFQPGNLMVELWSK